MSTDIFTTISTLLEKKFETFLSMPLNKDVCYKIYNEIFVVIAEILQKGQIPLSNESANYIAQIFYDGIQINSSEESLDPNIFTQRASLKNIETKELALLATMFKNHFMIAKPIINEIKTRS